MILYLAPPVPLPSEGSPVSETEPSPVLTFSRWLHPLLLGNLFPTFRSLVSCLWLSPSPLVSLKSLYCNFNGVWKGSEGKWVFICSCLMESTRKFSKEQLRRGKSKTSMVINSSCFIAFQVQLFVKSNLNKRIMLESSCLYSPHNILTPSKS